MKSNHFKLPDIFQLPRVQSSVEHSFILKELLRSKDLTVCMYIISPTSSHEWTLENDEYVKFHAYLKN